MVVAIALFVLHFLTKDERLVFWGETVGLVSFGISWMTARVTSFLCPVITAPSEKQTMFAFGIISKWPPN